MTLRSKPFNVTRPTVFADLLAVKNCRAELYLSTDSRLSSALFKEAFNGDDLPSVDRGLFEDNEVSVFTDANFAKTARQIKFAE